MNKKIILITGCSNGFGHLLVKKLLIDKYQVIATTRNKDLLEISLKSEKNGAKGTAEDIFDQLNIGKWKIKVRAKDVTGELRIEVEVDLK